MLETDRLLRFYAAQQLGDEPNVRDALKAIQAEPSILTSRLNEFNSACDDLNAFLHKAWFTNPDRYLWSTHEIKLKDQYGLSGVVPLDKLDCTQQSNHLDFRSVMRGIAMKTRTGEWEFPRTVTDPNQLVSALLIEGYGLYLEQKNRKPGLSRTFVLAFEEMLMKNHLGSNISTDVFPWMIEERDDFPSGLKEMLEQVKDLPLIAGHQMAALPNFTKREQMTSALHQELQDYLDKQGVGRYNSSFRAKTDESIHAKLQRCISSAPLMDIYGARFIIDEKQDPLRIVEGLRHRYETPDVFPWGTASTKDYRGVEHRPYRFSDPNYQAVHQHLIFGGSNIAEVQLMTPQQYQKALATRNYFEKRRKEFNG